MVPRGPGNPKDANALRGAMVGFAARGSELATRGESPTDSLRC